MNENLEVKDAIFTEDQLNELSGTTTEVGGLFYETLKQNSKQIKESQAAQLSEDLEFALRNEVVKYKNELRTLFRQKEAMIDAFLPSQTTSLKIAEGFDATKFAADRINYGVLIRDKSIRLTIALNEYKVLIGKDFKG